MKRTSNKRKDVIRIGDNIKVITPEIFVRCGYPLTKQIVMDTIITKEQREAIRTMFKAFGIPIIKDYPDNILEVDETNSFNKVLDTMAGIILVQKNWGGKERNTFTETKSELLDVIGNVIGKRIVKTGTYNSGHTHRYYDGEFDYDPAYLSNEASHIILKFVAIDNLNEKIYYRQEFEIEECHICKLAKI